MPKKVIAGFILMLLLVFSARHFMFKHYLRSQKNGFRLELFKSNHADVFTIQMDVEKLFLNENGIEWVDNNKELVLNGLYHEVLHIQIEKGKATISLIEDKFENALVAKFYKALSKEDKTYNLLAEFLQLQFIASTIDFNFRYFPKILNHLTAYTANITTISPLQVFIPPNT